ncbi:recombinase family protein [Glutamicibacter endophyticus]|uniref:recombinase family protein n=1 Tax=Glutamicibacter endophyticus TaxID=1522174 RepID=UPI003AEF4BA1
MRYGYTRTNENDGQHDALQRQALVDDGVDERCIRSDHSPGGSRIKDRPGWSELDARLVEGDEVVVVSLDCLGRSLKDVASVVGDLLERGVRIRSIEADQDSLNDQWLPKLMLMAAFAAIEADRAG